MKPQIISGFDGGAHNVNLQATNKRLDEGVSYKDVSTIIVIPALDSVPTKAVAAWWNMIQPPNQKIAKLFAAGMEVGAAYESTIEAILANEELAKWKYILTLEHDNIPPSDGLVKLLERAEAHPEFSVIGGLYWTKGPGGVAQCWGDPNDHPINFRPRKPLLDGGLLEVNGTGMGFTLYRLKMFKDKRLRRPWFKSAASSQEGVFTQDLFFAMDARKHGHRFAIDCGVRVGHYDLAADQVW
jgi:hypothetical protein